MDLSLAHPEHGSQRGFGGQHLHRHPLLCALLYLQSEVVLTISVFGKTTAHAPGKMGRSDQSQT